MDRNDRALAVRWTGSRRRGGAGRSEACLLFGHLREECLAVAGVGEEEQSPVSFKGHERRSVAQSRLQVTWLLSENRGPLSCAATRVEERTGVMAGFPFRPRWFLWGNSHTPSSGPEDTPGRATLAFYSKVSSDTGGLARRPVLGSVLRFRGPRAAA